MAKLVTSKHQSRSNLKFELPPQGFPELLVWLKLQKCTRGGAKIKMESEPHVRLQSIWDGRMLPHPRKLLRLTPPSPHHHHPTPNPPTPAEKSAFMLFSCSPVKSLWAIFSRPGAKAALSCVPEEGCTHIITSL